MKPHLQGALVSAILLVPAAVMAQQLQPVSQTPPAHVRLSAAYGEVLLRTTEVRAELESIAPDHADTSFRMIDLRSELEILEKVIVRLSTSRAAESSKLTLALGKLLVKKAALDTDLARLLRNYKAEHPDVRKTQRKVDVFEAAIKEVLP